MEVTVAKDDRSVAVRSCLVVSLPSIVEVRLVLVPAGVSFKCGGAS